MKTLKPLLLTAAATFAVAAPAAQAAAPANDHFANAASIGGEEDLTFFATTQEATAQVGEPDHGGAKRSVWFKYKPDESGGTRIVGSCDDLSVRVYRGTLGDLKQIAQLNGCGADVAFPAEEDNEYFIAVDAAFGKTPGSKALTLERRSAKPAIEIGGGALGQVDPSGSRPVKETTGAPGVELRCGVDQAFFMSACPQDGKAGWTLEWKDLKPGKHTLFVSATDDYANRTLVGVPVTVAEPVVETVVNPVIPDAGPGVTTAPSTSTPRVTAPPVAQKACALTLNRAGRSRRRASA